jgi:hypothetical protein
MINKTLRHIFILTVMATVLTATNVAQARVITDGLVSYWSFDKGGVAGNTVKDDFGNNDGTIDGSVEAANDGKVGEALKFSGGHIDCGADKSLTDISDQLTLEVWIKPEKAGWAILAGMSRSGGNTYVIAWSDQTRIDFNIWNGSLETWPLHSDAQPALNEWHHVAGVYDGSAATIYINGKADKKKDFSGSLKHNGENFWIGARKSDGLPFHGLLDELRVYNRALSQAEVEMNMTAEGLTAVEPTEKLALTWGTIKVSR